MTHAPEYIPVGDSFKCPVCGSKKVVRKYLPNRDADAPITCANGHDYGSYKTLRVAEQSIGERLFHAILSKMRGH